MAEMVNTRDAERACHDGAMAASSPHGNDDAVLLDAAGPMRRLSQSAREPGFVQDPYPFHDEARAADYH